MGKEFLTFRRLMMPNPSDYLWPTHFYSEAACSMKLWKNTYEQVDIMCISMWIRVGQIVIQYMWVLVAFFKVAHHWENIFELVKTDCTVSQSVPT